MTNSGNRLKALEARMAKANVFGQWQVGANRPENVRCGANGRFTIEPAPSGVPHLWRWDTLKPFLDESLMALPESRTARRSLILNNPELPKGTTHTLLVGLQTIGPGEIAWAHRHTVTALRFAIEGGPDVSTVVDGMPLAMEPFDLILTPGWCWHDHHNDSDQPAVWLDALDVPLMLALNQNFYEELGEETQARRDPEAHPTVRRFPWREMRPRLEALAREVIDPCTGAVLRYTDGGNGSTLTTLDCSLQWLPPGFRGTLRRHTSSAACFVIEGTGRTIAGDTVLSWGERDSFVVPNWAWHRHENLSATEPAILFRIDDRPLLDSIGLYREERDDGTEISTRTS